MPGRVLHITAQRPGWTGSGVTLEALVRAASRAGWQQSVLAGVPAAEPTPAVGDLEAQDVDTVRFGAGGDLPFDVPGMSDVMPYSSRVWSTLTEAELEAYAAVWRARIAEVLAARRPDVVHVHHAWLVASLVTEVAGDRPVVVHGHGTGLRQLELCPHLGPRVREGVGRASACAVLHEDHARRYGSTFGFAADQVRVVGAGYDAAQFRSADTARDPRCLLFAGKWSAAKGLPELLQAVASLVATRPDVRLEVAGAGRGAEADALAEVMAANGHVHVLGRVETDELAERMRAAAVFVLPSLYEGLPLVLVEAAACGARLVATALPGVVDALAVPLADRLTLVDLPPLEGPDRLAPGAAPGFVRGLTAALERALDAGPVPASSRELAPFTWEAVGERVVGLWTQQDPTNGASA